MGLGAAQALEERDEDYEGGRRAGLADYANYDALGAEREAGHLVSIVGELHPIAPSPSPVPESVVVDAPEPTPATPEPEPQGSIEQAICAYPWDCGIALRVARCESTLHPDAVGAGSYGLFQIQASVHAWKWPTFWQDWMIPERNLEYAWEIYQGRGWYAWSCF